MPLPHRFKPGTTADSFIKYGTYYRLTPVKGSADTHVITKPFLLPVIDTVNYSFQHRWNESDNLAKGVIDSIIQKGPAGIDTASRFLQRKIGGAPHVSACAIYVDSEPPTINVRTKMFSPDGMGSIVELIEQLRQDTHGATGTAPKGNSLLHKAGQAVQGVISAGESLVNDSFGGGKVLGGAGWMSHPEWWKIQVIIFSKDGERVLSTHKDMHCTNMNVVFYAPFYNNEPSMIELEVGFMHGFRGTRESMAFGKL